MRRAHRRDRPRRRSWPPPQRHAEPAGGHSSRSSACNARSIRCPDRFGARRQIGLTAQPFVDCFEPALGRWQHLAAARQRIGGSRPRPCEDGWSRGVQRPWVFAVPIAVVWQCQLLGWLERHACAAVCTSIAPIENAGPPPYFWAISAGSGSTWWPHTLHRKIRGKDNIKARALQIGIGAYFL